MRFQCVDILVPAANPNAGKVERRNTNTERKRHKHTDTPTPILERLTVGSVPLRDTETFLSMPLQGTDTYFPLHIYDTCFFWSVRRRGTDTYSPVHCNFLGQFLQCPYGALSRIVHCLGTTFVNLVHAPTGNLHVFLRGPFGH